jgi:hypothetical protein
MRHLRWLTVAALLTPGLVLAWGFDGHRRLASMLQDALPDGLCLKQWYQAKQSAALQDSACNPDRWRYPDAGVDYNPTEWPRHYLEVDWASPVESYPREQAAAQAQFGAYAVQNGQVPWRVEELYGSLVEAFRAKNEPEVLRLTFIFSHYVTDAFSLLHDTKNFDPNGLHSRWESQMLNSPSRLNELSQLATAQYLGTPGQVDPRNNIFDVVLVGYGHVSELVAADTAANGDVVALFASVKDLTARRMGDALTLLSALLWSAWSDAGRPELTGFSASCSRAGATGPTVLVGYPVPGGLSYADAGAGGGGGGGGDVALDAGQGGGGAPSGGAGCSCGATPAGLGVWGLLALGLLRRGRS